VQLALPKMIQEVQQAMMNEYIFAGISRILNDNVSDYGTIARRGSHFVIVLPETSAEEAPEIARTLEQLVREKMNVSLLAGTANFPGEAVTFEALMQIAMDDTEPKTFDPVRESGTFRDNIDVIPSKLEADVSSQRANI
jgi:GGDEF domain-containing protein